jgi:hypothetical protein
MLSADGRSPVARKATVSAERFACPEDVSRAPPVKLELLQPRASPGGTCGLPHGQAMRPATPGAHMSVPGTPAPQPWSSARFHAESPPAVWISPPAYSAEPVPESKAASALTVE